MFIPTFHKILKHSSLFLISTLLLSCYSPPPVQVQVPQRTQPVIEPIPYEIRAVTIENGKTKQQFILDSLGTPTDTSSSPIIAGKQQVGSMTSYDYETCKIRSNNHVLIEITIIDPHTSAMKTTIGCNAFDKKTVRLTFMNGVLAQFMFL